jgi:hypothetical protein
MKAEIVLVREDADRVFIADANRGQMSITNDAEGVVAHVHKLFPDRRIIYKDTEGRWDELKHNHGKFTNFAKYDGDLPE